MNEPMKITIVSNPDTGDTDIKFEIPSNMDFKSSEKAVLLAIKNLGKEYKNRKKCPANKEF